MSITNPDNFGFESVDAARPGPKSSAQTPSKPSERRKGSSKNKPGSAGTKSDKAIEFSKKIIDALKNKVKEHNSKNKKKVTLGQLKKVFRRGAGAFSSSHRPGQSRVSWSMARVNTFLRMVSGGKVKDSYRKADSDIARASKTDYIIEANFESSEEDFIQSEADIKNYNLNDFDFESSDELYLDDEEDGISIYGLDIII
jgi:hypothetical protein